MVFPDEDYINNLIKRRSLIKIEVLHSNDVIVKKTLEAYAKIKTSLDGALDNTGPAILVLYEPIWMVQTCLKKRE